VLPGLPLKHDLQYPLWLAHAETDKHDTFILLHLGSAGQHQQLVHSSLATLAKWLNYI
jgi:hypothetical protein